MRGGWIFTILLGLTSGLLLVMAFSSLFSGPDYIRPSAEEVVARELPKGSNLSYFDDRGVDLVIHYTDANGEEQVKTVFMGCS